MEHAALPVRPILGPDHTVVHLNDTLAYGQSQSEAMHFPCEPCVYTMKTVKDPFQMFDWDTYTSIAHEHFQHLLRNVH